MISINLAFAQALVAGLFGLIVGAFVMYVHCNTQPKQQQQELPKGYDVHKDVRVFLAEMEPTEEQLL